MEIQINRNNEKNNFVPKEKKKLPKRILKLLLLLIILTALVGGGIFAYKKIALKKNTPKPAPTNLIDQYKQDLAELKKQAEKTGSAEDLQKYGIAQYATGDASGAEQTYLKQIEKDPKSVIAHSGLANALRDGKKFDQAIEQYKKVIELAPTDISAYVNMASVYQYQMNQKDKAIEIYQQGIEKNPKSADLHVLMGLAYEQVGNIDNAKNAYQKALEIDENSAGAKIALERLAQ